MEQKDVEIDATDTNGCSALFYAVTLGHTVCTELLINAGALVNRKDMKGRTPAHCAAAKGILNSIKTLHKYGADLWMKNSRGDYPLHEAVHSGQKDLICWLLKQRPEAINTTNNEGRTLLHVAALYDKIEICKVLMDQGAFVNPIMRNIRGQLLTPFDAAMHRSNKGCAKYLQLHGGVPAAKITDKNALQRALVRAFSESQGEKFLPPQVSPTEKKQIQTNENVVIATAENIPLISVANQTLDVQFESKDTQSITETKDSSCQMEMTFDDKEAQTSPEKVKEEHIVPTCDIAKETSENKEIHCESIENEPLQISSSDDIEVVENEKEELSDKDVITMVPVEAAVTVNSLPTEPDEISLVPPEEHMETEEINPITPEVKTETEEIRDVPSEEQSAGEINKQTQMEVPSETEKSEHKQPLVSTETEEAMDTLTKLPSETAETEHNQTEHQIKIEETVHNSEVPSGTTESEKNETLDSTETDALDLDEEDTRAPSYIVLENEAKARIERARKERIRFFEEEKTKSIEQPMENVDEEKPGEIEESSIFEDGRKSQAPSIPDTRAGSGVSGTSSVEKSRKSLDEVMKTRFEEDWAVDEMKERHIKKKKENDNDFVKKEEDHKMALQNNLQKFQESVDTISISVCRKLEDELQKLESSMENKLANEIKEHSQKVQDIFKNIEHLQLSLSDDFGKKREELEKVIEKADTVLSKVQITLNEQAAISEQNLKFALESTTKMKASPPKDKTKTISQYSYTEECSDRDSENDTDLEETIDSLSEDQASAGSKDVEASILNFCNLFLSGSPECEKIHVTQRDTQTDQFPV